MTDDFKEGIAHVDGTFCPVGEARIPLLDWGFLRSDACQDTVSVWDGVFSGWTIISKGSSEVSAACACVVRMIEMNCARSRWTPFA